MNFVKRVMICALLTALTAGVAMAHPMGNFSINHYARIAAYQGRMELRYVIDMAEIPTVSEKSAIAAAGSDDKYLSTEASTLVKGLTLSIDGRPASLVLDGSSLEFRPGAGGLQILRIDLRLHASGGPGVVDYRDDNFPGRTGWKEIVAPQASATGAGFLSTDPTDALMTYPAESLSTPPQQVEAHIQFSAAASSTKAAASTSGFGGNRQHAAAQEDASNPASASTPRDAFTQAISIRRLTPGVMLFGLLIAFVFGAFHALSPGHGKAMVAAYLVGARGTVKHAVALGAIVTLTHTAGVFLLGIVTLTASQYVVPERLYPILSAVSGAAVFFVGISLLVGRIRGATAVHSHDHHHHDHDEDHPHSHDHDHSHTHDHDHPHTHDHDHDHGHSHGPFGHHHHHVPEGPITARSIVALGISGGIVPCPSALVVLLSAIALHRALYGLVLITAFSAGLASVLIAIGIMVVSASNIFRRFPAGMAAARVMPVFSAAVITCIGIVLVVKALSGGMI